MFYPKAVPPSVFQEELRRTFLTLHSVPDEAKRDFDYQMMQALIRYIHRRKDRTLKRCVEFLKPIEQGKYDRDGRLRRETLADDVKPWTVDIGRPTRYKIRIPARPGWVLGWSWRPAPVALDRGAAALRPSASGRRPEAIIHPG